jgi:hypothetical protein
VDRELQTTEDASQMAITEGASQLATSGCNSQSNMRNDFCISWAAA